MSTIYLSENAHPLLQSYLIQSDHKLKLIPKTNLVYDEVSDHADIYMCKLGAEPNSPVFLPDSEVLTELGYNYPENIKYNGVCMGKYFMHNLKYTSVKLLRKLEALGFSNIHVNQGYTKCNMVVINSSSAITADEGIYTTVNKYFLNTAKDIAQNSSSSPPCIPSKIRLLLIRQGHVQLGDFPYGFLGGASGRVGNEIIFNGNLKAHPDFDIISDFITSQGLKVKYFEEYPLTDIGSIIAVEF